jgi:diacylglycerol O-acyltransferase / wax synthase
MVRIGGPERGERVGPGDLVMLAMDAGSPVREQLGALLVLRPGPGFAIGAAERLLAERARTVPRLRQRIVPGRCGRLRPVWSEDPVFDPARHLRRVGCPELGGDRAMVQVAAEVLVEPLPMDRPLWRAVFVTGCADGRVGVVLVVHHCLADGIGGLAVLERLVDQLDVPAPAEHLRLVPDRPGRAPARRLPSVWAGLTGAARELRASLAAGGGLLAERAEPCSLLAPTGPRCRLATAEAGLAPLRAAAHRGDGTVNDALLVAVAGALGELLEHRGESVHTVRVAVPVAGPRATAPRGVGNAVAPLVVGIPTGQGPATTLRAVAPVLAAARRAVTAPAPIVVVWPLFRVLAAAGLYHRYMTHQRRIHTLVSNVHGPERMRELAGARVERIIPVAVGEAGNTTVNFMALSYAGGFTVTIVADQDRVPDLPVLADALQAHLDLLATGSGVPG